MAIASEILDALSHKPDFELTSILLAPDDWQPEIVERARAESLARGVDITEMQSKQQRELERFSLEPLSDNTKVCIVILAIFFGLLGFLFLVFRTTRLKESHYTLKVRQTWRIFWTTMAIKYGIAVIVVIIALLLG